MQNRLCLLALTLLGACSTTPDSPTASHSSATTLGGGAGIDVVSSRMRALDPNCRVIRALDGRAICAPQSPGTQRHDGANAADADEQSAAVEPPSQLDGHYVVIGSFERRENAARWAEFNADFGTRVQRVETSQPVMYRVLVGPLEGDSTSIMREIMSAVGIDESWRLSLCDADPLNATDACVDVSNHKLAEVSRP